MVHFLKIMKASSSLSHILSDDALSKYGVDLKKYLLRPQTCASWDNNIHILSNF